MIKLKNISGENLTLVDLEDQLLYPDEILELPSPRKEQAANSSQITVLVSNEDLAVIDNDDTQITDISFAIDILKGFNQKEKKTLDDKIWIQQTSRPFGTVTYFTSHGDDTTDPTNVGDGAMMQMSHKSGVDPLEQTKYIDLNIAENITFIHEGYLTWQNCKYDYVSMEIVPRVTTYSSSSNTYYNLYGGYLIIPAAGDGTIDVAAEDIRLIKMPQARDTGIRGAGFWNADYNSTTHSYENITAAPYGNGIYNMFGVEVILNRFVNKYLILNNGFYKLQSADTNEMGDGMRLRLRLNTYGDDHDWDAACGLTFHRERTI